MKYCRICARPRLTPIWKDQDGCQWYDCAACHCHSSDSKFATSDYNQHYYDTAVKNCGTVEDGKTHCISNCTWFDHHHERERKDFLDVGCLEGSAMMNMADLGWSVHGWDCNPASYREGCTTVTPFFAAHFFPQRYDAILCREVIEHVPGWRQFIVELTVALHRGGLLQIQTPQPMGEAHPIPYQKAHLQLFKPNMLLEELKPLGFKVWDARDWGMGFAYLLRLVDKPAE